MEIVEVVRRWQVGESQRAIARASGTARDTVKKYLRAAEELGLAASGPPPTEKQVVRLVQAGRVVSAERTWASPQGIDWRHIASRSRPGCGKSTCRSRVCRSYARGLPG